MTGVYAYFSKIWVICCCDV